MIVCALIPRLMLTSALGDRRGELLGRPVALAPEPGGPQVVGEASGAAEAFGVRAGMRLGEALSRCPALTLVAPDPVRAEAVWESSLRALESIGARVEPSRPGEAFFAAAALRGLYGEVEQVLVRARRVLQPEQGASTSARLGYASQARVGAGPNRLCARAAAARMRARRPAIAVTGGAARRLLAGLPVEALRDRFGDEWAGAGIPDTLRRLGVLTLGELAEIPAGAVADRFGEPGLRALRLARGEDGPLRPRRPRDEIECRLGLPEAASGQQLEHVLGLLVERLLAHPARAERTIRRLRIEARLAGAGGGWRCEVVLRSASADAERLLLALTPRLAELPGPASWLGLRAVELGPEAGEQGQLGRSPAEERRGRLTEAVRQVRSAAGRDAVLRVVEIDPRSRVPERRAILAPFSERDG
jgi:protein ImuB